MGSTLDVSFFSVQIKKMEDHQEAIKTALKIQGDERVRIVRRDCDIQLEATEGELHRQKRENDRVKETKN